MRDPTTPEFTVVIPTHDRWPFVAEAVESALALTGPSFEVVVVDDGSTDGTAERLEQRYPDVVVVRQPNRERGAARNEGVRRARGRWVTFLDSDDRFEPHHLEAVHERLLDGAPVVATMGALWTPDGGRGPLYGSPTNDGVYTLARSLIGNPLLICCLVLTPDRFWAAGGFPEQRAIAGGEDWVLVLRLLSLAPIPSVDVVTALVRDHPGRSMADPSGIIRARRAATALLLQDGLADRPVDDHEAALLRGGSECFVAAHLYESGAMREARRHLRAAVRELGPARGVPRVGRLYAQSLLGARLTRLARTRRTRRSAKGGVEHVDQ